MNLLNDNIVTLVQSLKKYYNLNQEHESNLMLDEALSSEKPKHVVLMCLDGLGYSLLKKVPFLQKNTIQKINSVFPPTTACATISLQTGLYPCEHGWIGWSQYFKEHDAVIELFSGFDFYTKKPYEYSTIIKDIKFKRFFEDIDNFKTFLPIFDPNGYSCLKDLLSGVKNHVNSSDSSFSYVYWNEPDKIMHITGIDSDETQEEMTKIDNLIKDFSIGLKDTMVIITADHGHIDCEPILLTDYPKLYECFSRLPSIEPRCTNIFIHKDKEEQFLEEVKPLLKHFDLYTKEEFLKSNFFNFSDVHFKVLEFLGDYILIATDKYLLSIDGKMEFGTKLKSAHAGSTPAEMEIPLIIIK